jgi:hypothetical protein
MRREEIGIDRQRRVHRFERTRPVASVEPLSSCRQLSLQELPRFAGVH